MSAPVVETLLHGYGVVSEQGSIGFGAVYLVTVAERRILFDCGHVGRRRVLLAALARHGLGVSDVDTLVLSHGHWDHLQNADLFADADVLAHPAELARLAGAPLDDPVTPPWSTAILAGLRIREATDGLVVAPGVAVTGLPGHTAGSIGLTVDTTAGPAVLTGDAVPSARSVARGRPSSAVDDEAAARSMQLVRTHAALVYPGHDRPFQLVTGEPGAYLLPPDEPPGP